MIIWVAETAAAALGKHNIRIATEDYRIADVVTKFGFHSIMTSADALTGTDRLWEASKQISGDIYINIQGDEPTINATDIQKVMTAKENFPNHVICGMSRLGDDENPHNKNIPKVVTSCDERMIYMSRAAVPASKTKNLVSSDYWKQVCIYAFNKNELNAFGEFGRKGVLEEIEDIELLRYLDLGIPIHMVELAGSSYAVDVPEDVAKAEMALTVRSQEIARRVVV